MEKILVAAGLCLVGGLFIASLVIVTRNGQTEEGRAAIRKHPLNIASPIVAFGIPFALAAMFLRWEFAICGSIFVVGAMLNKTVVCANKGLMPVIAPRQESIARLETSETHKLAERGDRLLFLADTPLLQWASIGDILVLAGLCGTVPVTLAYFGVFP